MTLAEAYSWTPEQVDRLDPAFVDEVLIARQARADHQLFEIKPDGNAEVSVLQARRRAEIVRWRETLQRG